MEEELKNIAIERLFYLRRALAGLGKLKEYGKKGEVAHSTTLSKGSNGKWYIVGATLEGDQLEFYEMSFKVTKTFEKESYQVIQGFDVADRGHNHTFTKQLKGSGSNRTVTVQDLVDYQRAELKKEPWKLRPGKNCHHNARKLVKFYKGELDADGESFGTTWSNKTSSGGHIPPLNHGMPKTSAPMPSQSAHFPDVTPMLSQPYAPEDFPCYSQREQWEKTIDKTVRVARAHGPGILGAAGNTINCFQEGEYFLGIWNTGTLAWSTGLLVATGGLGTMTLQLSPDGKPTFRISAFGLF